MEDYKPVLSDQSEFKAKIWGQKIEGIIKHKPNGKMKVYEDIFKQIDENGDGSVAFEEWLTFAMEHYKSKSAELPKPFDRLDKDAFIAACKTGGKDVYWFMWKCFQAADIDRDGLVSEEEFDKMIVMATANIKR